MKTLTRRKSTRHLIFGLLCLFPMLLVLFAVFRSGDVQSGITDVATWLVSMHSWPIINDFYDWFANTFMNGTMSYLMSFAFDYLIWLMFVAVIDLFFGFFFAMIDLFKSFMDRIGGNE